MKEAMVGTSERSIDNNSEMAKGALSKYDHEGNTRAKTSSSQRDESDDKMSSSQSSLPPAVSQHEALHIFTQQVEPMIHVWLNILQQYRRFLSSAKGNDEASLLSALKNMTDIASKFRQALDRTVEPLLEVWITAASSSPQRQPGMVRKLLRDVLSLPARVVLKLLCDKEVPNDLSSCVLWEVLDSRPKKQIEKFAIRQSAQAKLVQHSVCILERIQRGLYIVYSRQDSEGRRLKQLLVDSWTEKQSSVSPEMALHQDFTVDFMLITAMALPSGQEIDQHRRSTSRLDSSRLDCLISTCKVLTELTKNATQAVPITNSIYQRITEIIDGALFVRLVDTLTALILPMPGSSTAQSNNKETGPMEMVRQSTPLSDHKLIGQALETLNTWIRTLARFPDKWRQVFPGTFAALYQRLVQCLRASSGGAGGKSNAQKSIRTLNALLHAASDGDADLRKNENEGTSISALDTLSKLQQFAASNNSNNSFIENDALPKKTTAVTTLQAAFARKIQETLPIPFTSLVQILSNQDKFHSESLNLSIWLLSASCWIPDGQSSENEEKIKRMQGAAMDAMVIISSAQKATEWDNGAIASIVRQRLPAFSGRFTTLLDEISAACLGHRLTELKARVSLLCGYISCGGRKLQKEIKVLLLGNPTVQESFRKMVVRLFDVDFVHWPNFTLTERPTSTAWANSSETKAPRPLAPGWRFLDRESFDSATKMLELLVNNVLGTKGTCSLIDQYIADLYEACRKRSQMNSPASKEVSPVASHQEWLHFSISSLVVTKHLVESLPSKSTKSLVSLANAILPILTATPLVDFAVRNKIKTSLGSSSFFKGACCLKFFLVHLISVIVASVGRTGADSRDWSSSRLLLHDCLYSLVEASIEPSCRPINEMGVFCLRAVADACGFSSTYSMIQFCSGSLTSASHSRCKSMPSRMLLSQRMHSSSNYENTGNQEGLSMIVAVNSVLQQSLQYLFLDSSWSSEHDTELSNSRAIVEDLLGHFDRCGQLMSVNTLRTFLELFAVTSRVYSAWLERIDKSSGTTSGASEPSWMKSLQRFKKVPIKRTDIREDQALPSRLVTTDDTSFISKLITRTSLLLAHGDIFVQVESSQALAAGLNFLSSVAKSNATADETNGARTALLRHAADTWPVILSRFRSSYNGVRNILTTTLAHGIVAVPLKNSSQTVSHHSFILLEKVIDLIGVIVSETGDFMAGRFRETVWAQLSDLIQSNISALSAEQPVAAGPQSNHMSDVGRKRRIVLAAGRCCLRVYSSREAGQALSGIIPTATNTFSALVEMEGSLGELAVDVLKQMANYDYDAVLRGIEQRSQHDSTKAPAKQRQDEVLEAVKAYPEQELW